VFELSFKLLGIQIFNFYFFTSQKFTFMVAFTFIYHGVPGQYSEGRILRIVLLEGFSECFDQIAITYLQ
jgi:hypothetical protein